MLGVGAGLRQPGLADLLEDEGVGVAADDDRIRGALLGAGERAVVLDGLVRERQDAGASLLAQKRRGRGHRGRIRGREHSSTKRRPSVGRAIVHHHAEQADLHAPELDGLSANQLVVEAN